jgi:excinuclease ABC subunit B
MFDLEMLEEIGFCSGVENYSRHLTGRKPGEPPPTLLDYFAERLAAHRRRVAPDDPAGRRRCTRRPQPQETLVEHGFRLPSALDNRPLKFEEFEERCNQVVFLCATPASTSWRRPGAWWSSRSSAPPACSTRRSSRPIGRPGRRPAGEIRHASSEGERVLVTTLTKRMAEDLTEYYRDLGIRVRYLHSTSRPSSASSCSATCGAASSTCWSASTCCARASTCPRSALVAILDADKEGFLRERQPLIQTCGRAARNLHGMVIMYADRVTDSMQACLDGDAAPPHRPGDLQRGARHRALLPEELNGRIAELKAQMSEMAKALRYEEAAKIRDRVRVLEARKLEFI